MTTLVYEDVELRKGSLDSHYETARTRLQKFLEINDFILSESVTLRMSLCLKPLSPKRSSSVSNSEALNRLVQVPGATTTWASEDGRLSFDFKEKKYTAGDVDIYFTAIEQLMLYQKLVLKKNIENGYPQIKARLRVKFGKDFLEDCL